MVVGYGDVLSFDDCDVVCVFGVYYLVICDCDLVRLDVFIEVIDYCECVVVVVDYFIVCNCDICVGFGYMNVVMLDVE